MTFTWSKGSGAAGYWLYVGSSLGASDIYGADQGMALSRNVSGIPTDGRTIYVRVYSWISNVWEFIDYSYKAFTR